MKQKKKKRKEFEKKKEHIERLIKDGIIIDIRTLFEQEEHYIMSVKIIFGILITSNIKIMLTKIETCHLMNTLAKLKLNTETREINLQNSDTWKIQLTIAKALFLQKILRKGR